MIKDAKVFPMQKHTILINYIAEKIKAKDYLEIGIFNTAHNFDIIKIKDKIGVDPDIEDHADVVAMESDVFFRHHRNKQEFDIIFIDGLHHADQVKKDIINSWSCLNDGGCLIVHDTNPHSELITHVPRDNREWCGDVYKTICQIEQPEIFTLKDDYGVTVIRKEGELRFKDDVITWGEFDRVRNKILNLKTWNEATKIIDSWD